LLGPHSDKPTSQDLTQTIGRIKIADSRVVGYFERAHVMPLIGKEITV
jgi:hypothetical protein